MSPGRTFTSTGGTVRRPRVDNVEIFFSGHPEDVIYALVLQCRYEQISPVHRMRSRSFDVSIGIRSECRALKSNIELLDFDHTN
jgi:hypothetical protein